MVTLKAPPPANRGVLSPLVLCKCTSVQSKEDGKCQGYRFRSVKATIKRFGFVVLNWASLKLKLPGGCFWRGYLVISFYLKKGVLRLALEMLPRRLRWMLVLLLTDPKSVAKESEILGWISGRKLRKQHLTLTRFGKGA